MVIVNEDTATNGVSTIPRCYYQMFAIDVFKPENLRPPQPPVDPWDSLFVLRKYIDDNFCTRPS